MSEVSTTLQALDKVRREDDFNGVAGLRLYRAGRDLMVRGGFVGGCVGDPDIGAVRLSADDARALRDWLNEEFFDEVKRDDYGLTATAAMQKDMRDQMWPADEQGYIMTPWGYVRA